MGRELTPEQRRRKIDEIFGDVMPETTKDERQAEPEDKRDDDWYLSNKPPHHG